MHLGFILIVNLFESATNREEIVVFSYVKCAGVMGVHSLVEFFRVPMVIL